MSWIKVGVKPENKEKADNLRDIIAASQGRKPTFDEIFERGLEDLEKEIGKKDKKERDFMEIF